MANFTLSSMEGSAAGVPIGATIELFQGLPIDFTHNGARYLRHNFIETDTSKFDTTIFSETPATILTLTGFPGDAGARDAFAMVKGAGSTIVAFFAKDGMSTTAYRSTDDGVTWSSQLSVSSSRLRGVVYASSLNMFVVITDNGTVETSTDGGVTWQNRGALVTTAGHRDIHWNGTTFVIVGPGGVIQTSTNGTSWNARTSNVAFSFGSVMFGNGTWVAMATLQNAGACVSTDGGVTWTAVNPNFGGTAYPSNVVFDGSKFLCYTEETSNNQRGVYTSTNGVTWTKTVHSPNFYNASASSFFTLAYVAGFFIATGPSGSALLWRSRDGVKWTSVSHTNTTGSSIICHRLRTLDATRISVSQGIFNGTQNFSTLNNTFYAGNPTTLASSTSGVSSYVRIS
jgi:hypothetical protein